MELLQKPFPKLKKGELKKGIIDKFRSVTRFCKAAELDYDDTMKVLLTEKDRQAMQLIYLRANESYSMPGDNDLLRADKLKIRAAIKAHEDGRTTKLFCKRNGFDPTWVSRLISEADYGAVRSNSPTLKRLLSILKIEL